MPRMILKVHRVFDVVVLERNTSATWTERSPSAFLNHRVQSVINVKEGPKAGFLIADENAELGLIGADADVPLITMIVNPKVRESSRNWRINADIIA